MDTKKLRQLFGRLKGIQVVINTQNYVSLSLCNDYNSIIKGISSIIDEDLAYLNASLVSSHQLSEGTTMCRSENVREKLMQTISYLEYGFHLSEETIEIGSIYNSIKDEELKSRCSDLLSAPSNFDRVINQATQVLEDRIRRKSKNKDNLTGTQLINAVLNADITKSPMVLSQERNEHEGYYHTLRGLMMAYRNPTHHQISTKYTREQALIVCSFIDLMLQVIEEASVK